MSEKVKVPNIGDFKEVEIIEKMETKLIKVIQ
jgi:hypothetical protein